MQDFVDFLQTIDPIEGDDFEIIVEQATYDFFGIIFVEK